MEADSTKTTNSLNRRLGHLETEVAGLGQKVDGIESGQARQEAILNRVLDKMGEDRPTNWGTLISAVGLIVVLGGLCLAPIYGSLTDFKTSQRRQWEVIRSHMAEQGHTPMQIRVGALEEDSAHQAGTLSEEMELRDEKVLERVQALIERVDNIEKEQSRRTTRVYKQPGVSSP